MRVGRGPAATAAVVALALGMSACGGGSDKPKGPSPAQDRAAVRGTLLKLEQATAAHDYATMCNRVVARALAQVYSGAAHQKASTDVVQLVREGGAWRVAALAGPQPPAPQKPVDTP